MKKVPKAIRECVREISEGFKLVDAPELIIPADIRTYNKTKGGGNIQFYPSVARAFPALGMITYQLLCKEYFASQTRSQIKSVDDPQSVLHNSQERFASKFIAGIDYAGRLFESLRFWAEGKPYNHLDVSANEDVRFIPVDSEDNEFRKFYRLWANSDNEGWFLFNASRLEKSVKDSQIPQVHTIPQEVVRGYVLSNYLPELLEYTRTLGKIEDEARTESSGTLSDAFLKDRKKLARFFGTLRKMNEMGIRALAEARNRDLTKYPTWQPTDGSDIVPGDYIQGHFIEGEFEDGLVTSIRNGSEKRRYILSLSNVGDGFGLGEKTLRDIEVFPGRDFEQFARFNKLWKFVPGNY